MKRIFLFANAILVAGSLSFLSSCNNAPKSQEAEVVDTVAIVPEETQATQELVIDTSASAITWIGSKPGGQHNGTLGLSADSKLMVENGTLTGGTIMLDMTDITVLDLQDKPDKNADLVTHLKSDEFFAVETYPTSTFTITSVEAVDASTIEVVEGEHSTENPTHKITGNLKMMDVEKAISFYANVTMPEGEVKASAKFNIDRTEFNVSHMAEGVDAVKDKFINNTVNVGFDITAKAAM